jgi:uncharacterized protein YjiS (DUF1127 family)
MSTITMTPPTAANTLARIAGLAGTVALRIVNIVRAYLNRRDMQVLAGFDERMLADIGLTRSDVRDAVAEPLWRDPTSVLVSRAKERQLSRPRGRGPGRSGFVATPSLIPDLEVGLRSGKLTQLPARYH